MLLELPWLDVVCLHIFPFLSVKDWLSLMLVSKKVLSLTHEYFRVMRTLDLSNQNVPPAILKVISEESRHIKRLCLAGTNVTNSEIKLFFMNNPNLRYVNLSRCRQLTNGCLQPMAVNCKKLEHVILTECRWLSVGALETMSYHNTVSLTSADFSGCTSINENSLILFIARHPRLKELSLGHISFVKDRTLYCVARSCPDLQILDLQGCAGITDDGLKYILEYCHCLRHLDLRSCQKISERSVKRVRQQGTVKVLYTSLSAVRSNHYPPWRSLPI